MESMLEKIRQLTTKTAKAASDALQDYQSKLMLLEQSNIQRLRLSCQEHATTPHPDGKPGMPGTRSFATGKSPQGN